MKKQIINYNALQSITVYDKILNTEIVYGSYIKNFAKCYGFTDLFKRNVYNDYDLKDYIIEDNNVYYKPKIGFIFINSKDDFQLEYDSYELAEKAFDLFKTDISKNIMYEFEIDNDSLIFYK